MEVSTLTLYFCNSSANYKLIQVAEKFLSLSIIETPSLIEHICSDLAELIKKELQENSKYVVPVVVALMGYCLIHFQKLPISRAKVVTS